MTNMQKTVVCKTTIMTPLALVHFSSNAEINQLYSYSEHSMAFPTLNVVEKDMGNQTPYSLH